MRTQGLVDLKRKLPITNKAHAIMLAMLVVLVGCNAGQEFAKQEDDVLNSSLPAGDLEGTIPNGGGLPDVEEGEKKSNDEIDKEEAKKKAEDEAAKKQAEEEEAKKQAEEEAKKQAEEEAKKQAEEEAKKQAEEEAKKQAEEEAKKQAEEEAKKQAEEEAKKQAEEEAKKQAEEEAKKQAEEEAKKQAEEEAKKQAEEEAKKQAEEEAKKQAEEEAKKKAEEEANKVVLEDRVKIFEQEAAESGHKVDVLWVIDNSGSMRDNQNNLAHNFNNFINNFLNREDMPDFKMAVVTTDPRSRRAAWGDGKIVQKRILTLEDALFNKTSFVNKFQEVVRVGTRGSGTECSLLSALRGMQRNEQDFLRSDAMLVINILSDEKDSSVKYSGKSVEKLVKAIKDIKGEQRVIINSIVHKTGSSWKVGAQQIEASELTNGIVSDITSDFADTMSNIGEAVITLTSSFPLPDKPYNGELIVKVDGVELPEAEWEYDEALNTVKITEAPGVGSIIEVEYKVEIND